MKTTIEHRTSAARRLGILRILAESRDYSANEYTLAAVLGDMGHAVGQAQLQADLNWMEAEKLLSVQQISTVWIARITRYGLDVATDRATHTGVQRPQPE